MVQVSNLHGYDCSSVHTSKRLRMVPTMPALPHHASKEKIDGDGVFDS